MPSDIRTHAIVLRRTNYGESDRILNLLTPEGKMAWFWRVVCASPNLASLVGLSYSLWLMW